MKKRLLWVGLPLMILLVVLYVYRQALVLRVTGMRPFVEDRFAGWVAMGADAGELDDALGRIYDPKGIGPGSWVHELSQTAKPHEQAALKAEEQGQKDTAVREYRKAAILYYLARFSVLRLSCQGNGLSKAYPMLSQDGRIL